MSYSQAAISAPRRLCRASARVKVHAPILGTRSYLLSRNPSPDLVAVTLEVQELLRT
jgi:hypothetical protein